MEELVKQAEDMVSRAVQVGSRATATSVCILVGEAVAIAGGLMANAYGMLGIFFLMFVTQQLHERWTTAQNARGVLAVSIVILIIGIVLGGLCFQHAPYFVSKIPEYENIAVYVNSMASTLMIIAGIAGILTYRSLSLLIEMMGE